MWHKKLKSPKGPRPGHVMRGIEYAFIAHEGRDLTTAQLIEWTRCLSIYQGRGSRGGYSRAIRRTAAKLGLVRVGRVSDRPGRPLIWRLPST
jgi:hypothetical protein